MDAVRLRELEALFDAYLPDASKEDRQQIAVIQTELGTQQTRLLSLLDTGVMNALEYADALNLELTWGMRRCASVLGRDRCTLLFGLDDFQHVSVVEPGVMFQTEAEKMVSRYRPTQSEQARLLGVMNSIDPQQRTSAFEKLWPRRMKHWRLVADIGLAEENYNKGNVQASIDQASTVLSSVSSMSEITDTPLYLASWAEHIQGRGYEALSEWERATAHYQASLIMKDCLGSWLPALPKLTTEVKLGTVELFHSPYTSLERLLQVRRKLISKPNRVLFEAENGKLYTNLLEDSLVGLAEAHLATGNRQLAVSKAKSALPLAKQLGDLVGLFRIFSVLYQADAASKAKFETQVSALFSADESITTHPRVVMLLSHFAKQSQES